LPISIVPPTIEGAGALRLKDPRQDVLGASGPVLFPGRGGDRYHRRMCGRFAFYSPREAVLAVFGVGLPFDLAPRYNVAPSQMVAAIRAAQNGQPQGVQLRWGLVPFWAKDAGIGNRMINARAETLAEKPAFRNAWKKRRCLILANGFYEWRGQGTGKTPFFISRPDEQPIALAGLWERWEKGDAPLETCTIITTAANRTLRDLHDRMPVILPPDTMRAWLDPAQPLAMLHAMLQPAPDDLLEIREVSRAVNNPSHDSRDLILARRLGETE
jgi:putative SOS response-associated peptidase YedK